MGSPPEPPASPGLIRFFERLVRRTFGELRLGGEASVHYVSALLARFARTDQLYAWPDATGRPLRTVSDLLIEAERAWAFDAPDFNPFREREVRQHIGDYTLFMTGIFREHVEQRSSAGFYVREGIRAYQAVADFERSALHPDARLFAALASDFERYAGALTYMRRVYLRPWELPRSAWPFARLLSEW